MIQARIPLLVARIAIAAAATVTTAAFAAQVGMRLKPLPTVLPPPAAAAAAAPAAPPSSAPTQNWPSQAIGSAPVFQRCAGPARYIAPNETFALTCNVTSSLGGDRVFVVPEMWNPGNGCIATADKPRVLMVGNSYGVSATLVNRCGSPMLGSEGGIGWLIYAL